MGFLDQGQDRFLIFAFLLMGLDLFFKRAAWQTFELC